MGLFKSMKDLAEVTKSAKQMQDQQQQQAGYEPGLGGSMAQMGDMVGHMNEQLKEMTDDSGDRSRILAEGIAGQGVIVGMGTPERGAQWFNLDIDLEVHVSGRAAYRVANQYMVPATREPRPRRQPPDQGRPQRQGQDRDRLGQRADGPRARRGAPGEWRRRAAAGAQRRRSSGGDSVAELERLVKLRDSGALTDAEFEQQKARILGG